MSLFRQQALDQKRLPERFFTPVAVVSVRHLLWISLFLSVISMGSMWLIFGKLYTTSEITIAVIGLETSFSPPVSLSDSSQPIRAVAYCPQAINGIVTRRSDDTFILQLELDIEANCRVTLILHEETPLERLLP